jgi:hypothetical protein
VKTSAQELDMATVEERRYEEPEENIVKGHIAFKIKENKEDEGGVCDGGDRATHDVGQNSNPQEVPRPLLRGGCNQVEFKSFTQQWSLYAGCNGGMDVRELQQQLLNCADGPLEAAMYDALGSKVNTLSETDLMEELEKLAVEEIVAVMNNENYATMISKEEGPAHRSTAHRSPAHRSPAHSSTAHRCPAHSSTALSSTAHSNPAHSSTTNSSTAHSSTD